MEKKLIKNAVSGLVYQITVIVCGLVLPRMMLRHFGSNVNGLVNSVSQFLGIISALDMGVGAVVQSALYRPLADGDEAALSRILASARKFFNKIGAMLAIYILGLTVLYPIIIKGKFGFSYTAALIVAMGISSVAQYYFGAVNQILLLADQKQYIVNNIQTATAILNTLACLALIRLGMSVQLVKLATSLIYVLRILYLALYVKKHYNIEWQIPYSGEPIRQKWNGLAQHLAYVVTEGTDSVVLTIFADLASVSVYSVYHLVVNNIKLLCLSLLGGVQPLLGELWARQDMDSLHGFFGRAEWTIHTGVSFFFSVTAVLVLPFVRVYTDGVTDADYMQPLFAVLMTAAFASYCLRAPYNMMILAGGHYKQTQGSYIAAMLINIGLSIAMVKAWGLVGVALGTLAAMMYQTAWMASYLSKNLLRWPLRIFCRQVAVDGVTVALICLSTGWQAFRHKEWMMEEISYQSWFFLAARVTGTAVIVTIAVNLIFYRGRMEELLEKATWLKRRKNADDRKA